MRNEVAEKQRRLHLQRAGLQGAWQRELGRLLSAANAKLVGPFAAAFGELDSIVRDSSFIGWKILLQPTVHRAYPGSLPSYPSATLTIETADTVDFRASGLGISRSLPCSDDPPRAKLAEVFAEYALKALSPKPNT